MSLGQDLVELVLRPWREQRYALKTSRALLRLYEEARSTDPTLRGRALYLQVVRSHLGEQEKDAEDILNGAEQSYASWPVPRDLTFRDVVHYIVVTEYLAVKGAGYTQGQLYRTIIREVPANL